MCMCTHIYYVESDLRRSVYCLSTMTFNCNLFCPACCVLKLTTLSLRPGWAWQRWTHDWEPKHLITFFNFKIIGLALPGTGPENAFHQYRGESRGGPDCWNEIISLSVSYISLFSLSKEQNYKMRSYSYVSRAALCRSSFDIKKAICLLFYINTLMFYFKFDFNITGHLLGQEIFHFYGTRNVIIVCTSPQDPKLHYWVCRSTGH